MRHVFDLLGKGCPIPPSFGGVGFLVCVASVQWPKQNPTRANRPEWGTQYGNGRKGFTMENTEGTEKKE